jgi:ketosteroid isomerase-like protein
MTDDNTELVRKAIDAFNRGDFEGVIEFTHPEIEVIRLGGLPTVVGREAAFGLMLPDAFETQRIEVEEVRAEGDVVLVSGPFRAKGAGSGIELRRESHSVFWIVDGLITRMGTYLDRDEALAAAGLDR